MNSRRRVCVILVDRANYGRLKPVMRSIAARPELELQVIAAGTMVLERFDHPVTVVRGDGFSVDAEIYLELEGSTPSTMAKSVGMGIIEFTGAFQRLRPDVVVVIGDRYEMLAATIAAAFMNLCIVHIQGGEVSGSIDESTRHAITKFAHYHFPSTRRSAHYLTSMGEQPDTILGVGCPSSDIAMAMDRRLPPEILNSTGHGAAIDVNQPFLLTVFHPTTTEYGAERNQMEQVLAALEQLHRPTVLLWPNIDAGSDHISKAIRVFRDRVKSAGWLRTLTNLSPENYLRVLANTRCAVGNSSSFVRDAGYFGTPVVLVGNRQNGREADVHVAFVEPRAETIARTIGSQLERGPYPPSALYGNGRVSERIAEGLVRLKPYVQKRLAYVATEGQTDQEAGRPFAAGLKSAR